MKLIRLTFVLLPLLFILAACGGQDEAATPPPPTAVTEQTAPDPTATLEPAATATLPMPPTVAPAPTITPTPEPEATAVPAGVLLIEPEDFGDDRNPFTGELVSDLDNLQRRPIAVKMSNAPPSFVRPQSGLNDADLIFEHITEGHITRLTLIFYGNTPPDVGPIRSGRLIDVEIPAMYDAAFVFSGASTGVNQRLNRSDFANRILRGGLGYYRTGANKPYEHTLYGRLNLFWDQLEDLRTGYNTQKPKELIRRFVLASSHEGDTVADYYMGSGTTAEVCKELNRNFIGCDINPKAIEITKARLNAGT